MRVAALYDIHGNLPALEAVLGEVYQAQADLVVVGGDVLPGPMPRESLEALLNFEVPVKFLFGNGEVAVLDEMAGRTPAVPEQVRPILRWNAAQLDPELDRSIANWPKTQQLHVAGLGKVFFCHATPRNENECFTRLTGEERLLPAFAGVDAELVVCGHTHMQFDRMLGPLRVVNAGSVGMPFGEPGADWLLLGPDIQFRHTSYNLTEAAARIRATLYPQAEQFAAQNVLQPPTEEAMLAVFTQAELK